MWRSCRVQPSHKESTIGAVRCKKEGMLLQPLRWCCVECVIPHERDVREEQKYIYVARTSSNRVISSHDLYCCLLPQCEALRTCRSGFSDRNSSLPKLNVTLGLRPTCGVCYKKKNQSSKLFCVSLHKVTATCSVCHKRFVKKRPILQLNLFAT